MLSVGGPLRSTFVAFRRDGRGPAGRGEGAADRLTPTKQGVQYLTKKFKVAKDGHCAAEGGDGCFAARKAVP